MSGLGAPQQLAYLRVVTSLAQLFKTGGHRTPALANMLGACRLAPAASPVIAIMTQVNQRSPDDVAQLLGQNGDQIERIGLGLVSRQNEESHVARYRWAAARARGARVLDVASGTGYGYELLMRGGAHSVVCVDRYQAALAFGRDRFGALSVCADALALPFATATFDMVVSFETIEHLTDQERFLEECHRVLLPKGQLLLSTPNPDFSLGQNAFHLKELTRQQIFDLVALSGFHVTEEWGQVFLPEIPAVRTLIRSAMAGYRRRRAGKSSQSMVRTVRKAGVNGSRLLMRPIRRIPGMSPILIILTLGRE